MAVTIYDIAAELELSSTTVSRSLRNDPLIKPTTRARVAEAALRLGYQSKMRRGANHAPSLKTLGVLVADNLGNARTETNFVRIAEGITLEADDARVMLNLHVLKPAARGRLHCDAEALPTMLAERACDIVILVGRHDIEDVRFLAQQIPLVSVSWVYDGVQINTVAADNNRMTARLVEKLIALGHRRMAWVPDHYEARFFDERQAGFIQTCMGHELALHDLQFLKPALYAGGEELPQAPLLEAVQAGATALVCANDRVALQCIQLLRESGLEVPRDVSVTGFDARYHGEAQSVRVDSVDPQFTEIGRVAVRVALQHFKQATSRPQIITVAGEVVAGATIGKPGTSN